MPKTRRLHSTCRPLHYRTFILLDNSTEYTRISQLRDKTLFTKLNENSGHLCNMFRPLTKSLWQIVLCCVCCDLCELCQSFAPSCHVSISPCLYMVVYFHAATNDGAFWPVNVCVCVHVCALGLHVCVSAMCLSVITKVFAHALFVFKVSRPMQFIGFFTTSHGPSRSFLLFLPLHRLLVVFREKLQLRFRVVSNILEKDLSFDW